MGTAARRRDRLPMTVGSLRILTTACTAIVIIIDTVNKHTHCQAFPPQNAISKRADTSSELHCDNGDNSASRRRPLASPRLSIVSVYSLTASTLTLTLV